MDGAMAEALSQAEGEQDMEKKVEAALACPCLGALLRQGSRAAAGRSAARRPGNAQRVWDCRIPARLSTTTRC